MTLRPSTVSTVQLAWAQILGVDQDALADGGTRILCEKDDSSVLMFVSLFGTGVLVGPGWAIEAAEDLTDAELASHSKLLEISSPYGGQPLGEAALYFCDDGRAIPSVGQTVSRDPRHAVALEGACPTDDSTEVLLSEMANTFVLLDDSVDPPFPHAGAGYDIWAGSLAQMGVLTAPEVRRRGLALKAATIAMGQAMASGLIPQWRARTDNTASSRTAVSAAFEYAGTQTSVVLMP
ncbi:GNAT family N-acetyltransferase [Paeniglutamicibacter sp. ZC-3]|uniref:GNAT family N-acetyltransferase n=1 Tax=Paeniglutamicibacter sp. ZC-3 TaxID=2986919 RepID=UPI0021F6D49C|nr:GNAT family N-acetyltransferase [Paeniglutamicibacter sp. ZC-3]MCV9995427.1 GNAT family N-acetyltransferase [Paeniglutamicibacter sp. ZC-3]